MTEELKKYTSEIEQEEEIYITMKKKRGETENEVYTLQELCANDRELMKQIKNA